MQILLQRTWFWPTKWQRRYCSVTEFAGISPSELQVSHQRRSTKNTWGYCWRARQQSISLVLEKLCMSSGGYVLPEPHQESCTYCQSLGANKPDQDVETLSHNVCFHHLLRKLKLSLLGKRKIFKGPGDIFIIQDKRVNLELRGNKCTTSPGFYWKKNEINLKLLHRPRLEELCKSWMWTEMSACVLVAELILALPQTEKKS